MPTFLAVRPVYLIAVVTVATAPRISLAGRALGHVQTLIYVVIAVHIGVWIVSALYYDITQVRYVIGGHQIMYLKPGWDHLPKYFGLHSYAWWTTVRHAIRNVYEGLLGGLLGMVVGIRWKAPKRVTRVDKVLLRLHFPTRHQQGRTTPLQLILSPLTVSLAGLPGFAVALAAVKGGAWLFHHYHSGLHWPTVGVPHVAVVQDYLATWQWQYQLIGLVAGLFYGRKAFFKVAEDIQLFFIERRVAAGRRPRSFYPLNYRMRYDEVLAETDGNVEKHGVWISILMPVVLVIGLALTVDGIYVRFWIAKGR
jgi:hypothetical protein